MTLKEFLEGFTTCSERTQGAILSLIDWMGEDHFITWIQEEHRDIGSIGTTALLHAWNCMKE